MNKFLLTITISGLALAISSMDANASLSWVTGSETIGPNTANISYMQKNGNGAVSVIVSGGDLKIIGNPIIYNNTATGTGMGGAFYINGGQVSGFSGVEFNGNTATDGGAIALNNTASKLGVVTNSKFFNNKSTGTANGGGAIFSNAGEIAGISDSEFTGNTGANYGGAIYTKSNDSVIKFIRNTDFLGNEGKLGGAIANVGSAINMILDGSFVSNKAMHGGAIHSTSSRWIAGNGTINIKGTEFLYNNATYDGGAVYNVGGAEGKTTQMDLNNVTFDSNTAGRNGGAVYNANNSGNGKIKDIKSSTFTNNSADAGGAISNSGEIGNVNANFSTNTAIYNGGAIYNSGEVTDIKSSGFTENSANAGGAIYNTGEITNIISSDFTENSTTGNSDGPRGGAIYNMGKIGNIVTSSFTKNEAKELGGALFNNGEIGDINANFSANTAEKQGGAIENFGSMGTINSSTFDGNNAKELGGAIVNSAYNYDGGTIEGIFQSTFQNNTSGDVGGGAIYNNGGKISDISRTHFDNNNTTGNGGAIYTKSTHSNSGGNYSAEIHITDSQFTNNHADKNGGAVMVGVTPKDGSTADAKAPITTFENTTFKGNTAKLNGGAIHVDEKSDIDLTNTVFEDNKTDGLGGAISSYSNINLAAKNSGTSRFTGNMHNNSAASNAVFMRDKDKALNLSATDNGQIIFDDGIDGIEGYKINVDGDETGVVNFNNDIRNADISLKTTTANVKTAETLNHNNSLSVQSGIMNIANFGNNSLKLRNFEMTGGTINIGSIDTDLANKTMGTIAADTYNITAGNINVKNFVLTSDGEENKTSVLFAADEYKSIVGTDAEYADAPVYRYNVAYDANTGEFIFTRVTPKGEEDYEAYNPASFGGSVSASTGLDAQISAVGKVINYGELPKLDYTRGRVWALPYYDDDTVEYSNFYNIDSRNYGIVAGVDSKTYCLTDQWKGISTLFGAVNDGKYKYQGVSLDQDSYTVGLKTSVYRDNFYGDAVVNYTWHDGKLNGAHGDDNIDAKGYGAALKFGYLYNDASRYVLDTSLMLNWQQIDIDDYTTAGDSEVSNDTYSRLLLTPQFKAGYKVTDNLTPYAVVRYNVVFNENGAEKIDDVALPEIESKDYIEYGIGLNSTSDDNVHNANISILRHDIGREGWAASLSYRYNF